MSRQPAEGKRPLLIVNGRAVRPQGILEIVYSQDTLPYWDGMIPYLVGSGELTVDIRHHPAGGPVSLTVEGATVREERRPSGRQVFRIELREEVPS